MSGFGQRFGDKGDAPHYFHDTHATMTIRKFYAKLVMHVPMRTLKHHVFMVMDLVRWRAGDYTRKIEKWMEIQKERRIYKLGSLPPFLLAFGGNVEAIEHRWNQHGLGGDNVRNSCRTLHPGPVSLLHWSGKGKPWTRLDAKMPCSVDFLWAPSRDSSTPSEPPKTPPTSAKNC